jgi:hypothetical protein
MACCMWGRATYDNEGSAKRADANVPRSQFDDTSNSLWNNKSWAAREGHEPGRCSSGSSRPGKTVREMKPVDVWGVSQLHLNAVSWERALGRELAKRLEFSLSLVSCRRLPTAEGSEPLSEQPFRSRTRRLVSAEMDAGTDPRRLRLPSNVSLLQGRQEQGKTDKGAKNKRRQHNASTERRRLWRGHDAG